MPKRADAELLADIDGMRDRLIHHYAGVNWEIVWDVIEAKLPQLKDRLPPVERNSEK
jgi:uncharacterized protein with HEPN domain